MAAEISEFCRFLEPTADETAARKAATERVSSVVTAIWPSANVQVCALPALLLTHGMQSTYYHVDVISSL